MPQGFSITHRAGSHTVGALPHPVSLPRWKPEIFERLNILSFVGAMKIARNVAVSGRYVEWYAPHPGSLSEGAGSPKG